MNKDLKNSNGFFRWLSWGLIVWFVLAGCTPTGPVKTLQVDDKAANFSLPDASGRFMKLSDVQPGAYLVLILYRGSWCGACVDQLLDLKQDFEKFVEAHVALAAISTDSVSESAVFNTQWRFPFPLLSDTSLRLIDAYGARDPKGGEQDQDISHPAVIIIGPQKIIRYLYVGKNAWDRPNDDEILYEVQKIKKTGHS